MYMPDNTYYFIFADDMLFNHAYRQIITMYQID